MSKHDAKLSYVTMCVKLISVRLKSGRFYSAMMFITKNSNDLVVLNIKLHLLFSML